MLFHGFLSVHMLTAANKATGVRAEPADKCRLQDYRPHPQTSSRSA